MLRTIPSGGIGSARRRVRLLALLAVRNGEPHLPGFLRNIAPHVEGIVALDDGSSDGSAELLERSPAVVELLRVPRERTSWDEMGNHRLLVEAAGRHAADWVLSIDVDERVERSFRSRAERVIRRGAPFACSAFAVRLYELWGSRDTYRVDGIWGRKLRARLFRPQDGDVFDDAALHASKAPLQDRPYRAADLRIYHLGMLTPADRERRRRRYEQADPDGRWQSIGYAYLTDETGLRVARVPRRRSFTD